MTNMEIALVSERNRALSEQYRALSQHRAVQNRVVQSTLMLDDFRTLKVCKQQETAPGIFAHTFLILTMKIGTQVYYIITMLLFEQQTGVIHRNHAGTNKQPVNKFMGVVKGDDKHGNCIGQ
jgi:hypothetical protein